jgi:hypothetical protein
MRNLRYEEKKEVYKASAPRSSGARKTVSSRFYAFRIPYPRYPGYRKVVSHSCDFRSLKTPEQGMRLAAVLALAGFALLILALLAPAQELTCEAYASYDDRGKYFFIRFPHEVYLESISVGGEVIEVGEVVREYKLYYNYKPVRYTLHIRTKEGVVKKLVQGKRIKKAEVSNASVVEIFSAGYERVLAFSHAELPSVLAVGDCDTRFLRRAGFRIVTLNSIQDDGYTQENLKKARDASIVLVCRAPLPWELRNSTVFAISPEKYYEDADGRAHFEEELRYTPLESEEELLNHFGYVERFSLAGDARRLYFIPRHREVVVFFDSAVALRTSYKKNLTGALILVPQAVHPGWSNITVAQGEYVRVLPQNKYYPVEEHKAKVFLDAGENLLLLYSGGKVIDAAKLEVPAYRIVVEKRGGKYLIYVNGNLTEVLEKLPKRIYVNGYPVNLPQYRREIPLSFIASALIMLASLAFYLLAKPGDAQAPAKVRVLFEEEEAGEEPKREHFIFGEHALSAEELYEQYRSHVTEPLSLERFRERISKLFDEHKGYYHPKNAKLAYLLRKAHDHLVMNGYIPHEGKYWKDRRCYEVGVATKKQELLEFLWELEEKHRKEGGEACSAIIFAPEELKEELLDYKGMKIVFV